MLSGQAGEEVETGEESERHQQPETSQGNVEPEGLEPKDFRPHGFILTSPVHG